MSDRDATDSDCTLDHGSDSDLIPPIPEDGATVVEYQQVTFIPVVVHET